MKKILCTLLAAAVILSVLPARAFAKSDTVKLYGNKISVHAKQICFVKGSKDKDSDSGRYYDGSFEKYYYVGDEAIDIKLIAEKLPELQNLVVIRSDVKNVSALSELKDLVWLGFHQCSGTEDLSFLKNLTGLKKFRYTSYINIYSDKECKSIKPVSYLKNLTELYLNVPTETAVDLRPLKGLTKLKKLEMEKAGSAYIDVLKNLKNLRELDLRMIGTTDMTFIKNLKKLESLNIVGQTKNIKNLAELKNLKKLHIGDTREDLSFIGEMTQLEKLFLSYTNETFTKKIVNLKNLKELSLSCINNGRPYDTSFIPKLTSLESLTIYDKYDDIYMSGISKLKKLKRLVLAGCKFGDLSELKKCSALEEIIIDDCASDFDIKWLEGTGVKDLHISIGGNGKIKNIGSVTSLKKLEHLLLFFTGISEQSVKKIKKSLPNCKIEVWEYGEDYELETKIY